MRKLSWFAGGLAMAFAGLYTVVSLARWEWSRALFFGLAFIAAELGLVAGAVLSKLSSVERRIDAVEVAANRGPDPAVLEALRGGRDEHDRFPWLQVDPRDVVTRTNVFITLVVGGGVLLSAGTWVIDKVAGRTVDPGREARLGQDLGAIAYRGGLVVDDMEAPARSRPDQEDERLTSFLHPRRVNAVRPLSVLCAAIVIGGGVFVLRHNTQSTHVPQPATSTMRVEVEGRSNRAEPSQTLNELTEAHVWFCRLEIKSDVIGELDVVRGKPRHYAFTLQPSLDATDAKQYKGCLQDWVLDHHKLRVISMERGPDRPAGGTG